MISRMQLSALLLLAVAVWAGALILTGVQVSPEWFRPFSTVVGVLVLVLLLVDKWLWRIRWLQPWLLNMPDIQGTWLARIRPTGVASTREEINAFMVIRQTLSAVSLRLLTAESHSEVLCARIARCDDGTFQLAGVYRNTPRLGVRDRSPVHHGALLLALQGNPPASLAGQYWTDRNSQGEIFLSARIGVLAHSFDQAQRLTGADAT
jgi:predicted pore-forming effector associated with SMODS systems